MLAQHLLPRRTAGNRNGRDSSINAIGDFVGHDNGNNNTVCWVSHQPQQAWA